VCFLQSIICNNLWGTVFQHYVQFLPWNLMWKIILSFVSSQKAISFRWDSFEFYPSFRSFPFLIQIFLFHSFHSQIWSFRQSCGQIARNQSWLWHLDSFKPIWSFASRFVVHFHIAKQSDRYIPWHFGRPTKTLITSSSTFQKSGYCVRPIICRDEWETQNQHIVNFGWTCTQHTH